MSTLAFIDESGDSGIKFKQGSSQFFTISLVVFQDEKEAQVCDDRVKELKHELGWGETDEFHFLRNSDKVRRRFLEVIALSEFTYYGIVINKAALLREDHILLHKQAFYQHAVGLVFESAKARLNSATVIIDQSGNKHFKQELSKYLRYKMNAEKRLIKHIKMQNSRSNNLLQLTDYVAGVINRSAQKDKKFAEDYHKIIAHREEKIQIWPK